MATNDNTHTPYYTELADVRADLELSAKEPLWAELPQQMLSLIAAFEKAGRLIRRNGEFCEHIDARFELADYFWAERRMAQAADHLAAACRLVAHRARPEDRSSSGEVP